MAKRFIDTGLFRKPFMRSLEAPYKALWIYLLCECDHAGVWCVELDVAEMRMGMKLDPVKALEKMQGAVIEIDGGAKWFLPDFIEFQYGTLNAENRVHESVLKILEKNNIDLDNIGENKPLISPLQGRKDKDKEKVSIKKKDAKIEKDEGFEKFWIAYERKGNRKSAEQEWQKISPEDHAAIMANVPRYNASKPDIQFRRDGERYLKHRVWEDAIVIPTNKTATNGQARTQAERDAELDRIVDERYGL